MMEKTVVFMAKSRYPDGDASSKRNICLSRYFYDRGYEVKFVGLGNTDYKKEIKINNHCIVSLRKYSKKNLFFKFVNHFLVEKRIVSYCKKNYSNCNIWLVDPTLYKIVKKDKFFNAKNVIYLAVEFFSPSEYKFNGLLSRSYRDNYKFNSYFEKKDGKILSISSYLNDNFNNKGVHSIRIPFVTDYLSSAANFDCKQKFKNNRTFIYCGSPGNKDLIKKMIKGFLLLEDNLFNSLRVIFCGVDFSWVKKNFSSIEFNRIKKVFSFTGRVPIGEITKNYEKSTFSILLRPFEQRYSKAGFPTKISESLEFGIIPITNFTSDLSLYLKDLSNSIEVEGEDEKAFCLAIRKALLLNDNQITNMRINCKKTSLEKLDVRCFYDELDHLIGEN